MKYNKQDIDSAFVRETAERYKISLLSASVMARRGWAENPEEVSFILEEDLKYIHNPFLFSEMEDAVDRIHAASDEGEKVIVFGDRDVDGITSTVLIVNKLKEMGIDVSWSLPSGDEPYGITEEKVKSFAENDGTLMITVDCGISSVREIKYAKKFGIDTIIIDHHTPGEEIPEAFAIINPKMEDSGYPFRDLAGCGVVSKVIWALTFSETDFYKRNISILNIVPGGEKSYIIEAQKLFNLIEYSEPVRETIVQGIIENPSGTNLSAFLNESLIVVFNGANQKKLFTEAFGSSVELNAFDISDQIYKEYPRLEGMSLLQMREISRDSRYTDKTVGELDILRNLFTALVNRKHRNLASGYENILDLVAVGSIADMMPLKNENRIIVRHGLKNIQKTENIGLHDLLLKQKLMEKPLVTSDIAWNITPVINATGRMGVPEKAAQLLFCQDRSIIRELTDEVISLNKERKKLGEKNWDNLKGGAERSYQEFETALVLTGGKNVPRGITGILSARFASYFNAPAVIYTVLEDRIVGSVRSLRNYPIMNMLSSCSDLFSDFGGHDFAGGFSMPAANLDKLKTRLLEYMKNNKKAEVPERIPEVDAELPAGYMNDEVLKTADLFAPYGEGNPPLVFLARKMKISSVTEVGNKKIGHLKMTLESGGRTWPAMFWNASDRLKELRAGAEADVIFRVGHNYFQNNYMHQLIVLDMSI